MRIRAAAAWIACTMGACSGGVNPVAPSAPPPAPEPEPAAAEPMPSGLPAAVRRPLEPPSIDVDPPLRFDVPRLPPGRFERPSFPASGHLPRPTGLRIVSDDREYPRRIDQHGKEKLRAVITRRDGTSVPTGADWRTSNTHVATVNRHGHVTAHHPGGFYTNAAAHGLEARMNGMVVHPAPSRRYDDRFWQELVYDRFDTPTGSQDWQDHIWVLDDPLPGFYLWLGDPSGRRVASDKWISWARRNVRRGVESLTGEPYSGRIEGGLADRDEAGWITIVFDTPPHETESANVCGRARLGANPGRVWLNLDARGRPHLNCGQSNFQVYTILHEIGHAMGFRHVADRRALMAPGGGGRYENFQTAFTSREQYHARLAYRIGRGYRKYCGWPLRVACGDLPRRGAAPRTPTLP